MSKMKRPPEVPETPEDLERAVLLLGAVAKGQGLKEARQEELLELLGLLFLPAPEVAQGWKSELKRLRKELLASGEG